MNDICIYTGLYGKYDYLPRIMKYDPSIQYLCFTDNVDFAQSSNGNDHWNVIYFSPCLKPKESNRLIKIYPAILSHYLDSHYSVYIDANIDIVGDVRQLLPPTNSWSICTFDHPFRHSLFEEVLACAEAGHFPITAAFRLFSQITKTLAIDQFRLQECSVVLRNHMNAYTDKFCCVWLILYNNFGLRRDQCWFGLAIQLTQAPHVSLGESDARSTKAYFSHRLSHRPKTRIRQRLLRQINKLIFTIHPDLFANP
jgi:hypothetical protein